MSRKRRKAANTVQSNVFKYEAFEEMANPEHLALLWRGKTAIEQWRLDNPGEGLKLRGVDLSGIDLCNADLSDADLTGARIIDAKLVGAKLRKARLSGSYLVRSDFAKADLTRADFTGSEISKTSFCEADMSLASFARARIFDSNISGCNLYMADFSHSSLRNVDMLGTHVSTATLNNATVFHVNATGSNFINSSMGATTFAGCNLAHSLGLQTIRHDGPSHIDLDTLAVAFRDSSEYSKPDIKAFLLGAGMDVELIGELPRILSKAKYHSIFICYGWPDYDFARKLVEDLRAKGVICWMYSMDYTIGDDTWKEINKIKRKAGKMLVLCSAESLIREGVLKEIEEQIDEDQNKIIPISLDNLWKERGFVVKRGDRDLKPYLISKNYADFSDSSMYDKSFSRLLKALRKKNKR